MIYYQSSLRNILHKLDGDYPDVEFSFQPHHTLDFPDECSLHYDGMSFVASLREW